METQPSKSRVLDVAASLGLAALMQFSIPWGMASGMRGLEASAQAYVPRLFLGSSTTLGEATNKQHHHQPRADAEEQ